MAKIKNVVIMAGGTGGHVFPGLAIAKALQEKNIAVSWLGSVGGMETTLVPQHGIALHSLSIKGLRGKSLSEQLHFPFRLLHAIYQARQYFKKLKPDLVLGMGGFVAGPGAIAAKLSGTPLIIHEQNSIAGMTNRWLARIANKVLCAFPNTFPPNVKAIVTGNPVRQEIQNLRYANHQENLNLLIFGGSRGAQIFNEVVPQAIALLSDNIRPTICHQSGIAQQETTEINYKKHQVAAEVIAFIDDMAKRYAAADVLICRAGALTLAEITAIGLPAVLIPYPHAVDDHQTANAQYLVKNGAAILLPQSDLSAKKLSEILEDLLNNHVKRLAMAEASRALRKINVTENIIDECYNTAI